MNKILFVLLLSFSLLSGKVQASSWTDVPFSYNGKQVTIKGFKGKTLIIMFWATWCPYCESEIPQLSVLKNYYSSNPNIEVLALSIDKGGDEVVKNYFSNSFSNLDIVTDPQKNLFRSLGGVGVPTIILVSKEGQLIETYNKVREIDTKLVQSLIE